jgi:hypothetical protein
MRRALVLLIIIMLNFSSFGQYSDTLNYAIIVKSDTIGKLISIRNTNADNTIDYDVHSSAKYRFLFTFEIDFDYQTIFDADGIVSHTDFIYKFNGKIKEENSLERNISGYNIYMEGKYIKSSIGFYYQYRNGICEKILIDMTLVDMEIQLID